MIFARLYVILNLLIFLEGGISMFSSIVWPTWDELFHGDITFKHVGEIFSSMFSELLGHQNFAEISGVISMLVQKFVLPIFAVLAILSLIFAVVGRKLLPQAKFIAFFSVGFIFGVAYIAPLLFGDVTGIIPPIVGGLVGIVAAFLSKPLYIVLYIVAFAYSSYMIFMGGQLLPESLVSFTKDNMVMALVVVCITVVLVFLLRRPIESIGTALLGGYLFSLCIDKILCDVLSAERIPAVSIAVMLLVAIFGATKQFKSKKSGKTKGKPQPQAAAPVKPAAKPPVKSPAKAPTKAPARTNTLAPKAKAPVKTHPTTKKRK